MSRKSFLVGLILVVVLLGGTAAVLGTLLRHEPAFYAKMAVLGDPHRPQLSQDVHAELSRLFAAMQYDKEWYGRFSDQQINGLLQEEIRSHADDFSLPDGIRDPRVAVEEGRIRIGFRYGKGSWSTIISLKLRAWLVPRKVNMVALEVQGVCAGALPISAQSLLERLADVARRRNVEVSWYRHEGHPVALLQFQADQARPTVQLQQLDLRQGTLLFGGHSIDATPVRAMLTPDGAMKPTSD